MSRVLLAEIAESSLPMLPFRGLSVCLSVTFVHCAQAAKDIDTISLHTTASCLSHIMLWLISVTPSSPNFAPK